MEEGEHDPTQVGVTLEQIEKGTIKDMRDLAKSFNPPVSLARCQELKEQKERLRCAYMKAAGKARDIDALSNLMEALKCSDTDKRQQLVKLFQSLKDAIKKFQECDEKFSEHLDIQEVTRNIFGKINKFINMLQVEECPIVVAGQVSSGKSTLLNLFLGRDVLPNRLLSCTATICELAYAETDQVELHWANGTKKNVPFADKDKYIYKESEREDRFDHESVKLSLPVTFLKSGVVLVDTPGIGENVTMGSVLPDYVKKHDVFGFIFVIKCDDSGGVLIRFKELIRNLAAIKDEDDQYKFEPSSVIFIANFWDKVPDEEKEKTKKYIIDTLESETCLQGFDPEKQLFFLSSLFALNTWKVGLISEEYDKVIGGIESFFPKGHHRKLEIAYSWLEQVVQRLMLRVVGFLSKAVTPLSYVQISTQSILNALEKTKRHISLAEGELMDVLEETRSLLQSRVKAFLQSDDAEMDVTTWRRSEIPKEEYGDSWILLEERLEDAINQKISIALQNWEIENRHFNTAEAAIITKIHAEFNDIFEDLVNVGRGLRSMTAILAKEKLGDHKAPSKNEKGKREFRVNINFNPGESLMSELWGSLLPSRSLLFRSGRLTRQERMQKDAQEFQRDKVAFMKERSGNILQMISNDTMEAVQFVQNIVDEQLKLANDNIVRVTEKAMEEAKYTERVSEDILTSKHMDHELLENYKPLADAFNIVLEDVLGFKYGHCEEYPFADCMSEEGPNISTGCFGEVCHKKLNGVDATVKKMNDYIQRRHVFYTVKHLKMSSLRSRNHVNWWPEFLGLLQNDVPSIVLEAKLQTARTNYFGKHKSAIAFSYRQCEDFLKSVTAGIDFLHIKKLVHMEVSLDSILINQRDGSPKLSNIFESMPVPFPTDQNAEAGNYVYISPETFPDKGLYYTAASDMYGLGLLMLELLAQQDIYQAMKTSWTMKTLLADSDPGTKLYGQFQHSAIDEKKMAFVKRCLHPSPWERTTMKEWRKELDTFRWP